MIVASLLAAGWIATQPAVLLLISVLGALFLVKMGVECFSIEPPEVELSDTSTSGSLRRGVLTNLQPQRLRLLVPHRRASDGFRRCGGAARASGLRACVPLYACHGQGHHRLDV
jgi:hypothetical protein